MARVAVVAVMAVMLFQLGSGNTTQPGPPPPGGKGTTTAPPPRQQRTTTTQPRLPGKTTTKSSQLSGGGRTTTKSSLQGGKTTTAPVPWVTKSLSKADLEKLKQAFDDSTTLAFSGQSLFDSVSGNVSDDFLDLLDSDEKGAVRELQSTWKDVIDLTDTFKDAMPEDVQFFTQQFDKMDKSKLRKLTDNPGTIQASDLKDIPLEVIGAMNETVRLTKLALLPPAAQDGLCDKLQNEETDYDTTKRITKGLNCAASLKKTGKLPKGSLAEAIAENKVEAKKPRLWTQLDWQNAIRDGWFSGLPDFVIEKCPSAVVRDNMRPLTKITEDMDDQLKERLFSKIQDAAGGFRQMSATDISDMGDMVKDLKIKDLKQMDASAVRNSLSTFSSNARSMNRAQKMQLRKTVVDGVGGADNMTTGDVVSSAAFIGRDRNLLKKIDKDVLIANISGLGKQDFDRKSARTFAKKIRESSDYNEANDFDTSKFRDLGNVATGLPPRFVENMTGVDFSSLLDSGDLTDVDFSKDSSRVIVKRIIQDGGKSSISKTDMKNLGKNVKGLRTDDIDKISADDLAGALDEMKDTINTVIDEIDATTVDTMIKKVELAAGGLGGNLEKMGSLLQKVPVSKLQSLSDNQFGDMSGQTPRNFNCSKDTCPELYKRVVSTIGRPGIKNSNMTMTVYKNLGKVMCGMPVEDMKLIPATKMLEDIAGHLLKLKCLSDKQERVLAEKIKYRLGLFSRETREIKRQDVKKFGGLMKHFKTDDLDKLGGDNRCSDIALELGVQDLSNVKKEDLKELAKYALKCANKTSGALNSDDMTSLGDLACGISSDRIDDVDDDAMSDVVSNVQSKCVQLSGTERKQWATKSMKKLNMTSDKLAVVDEVALTQTGTFVAELSSRDLDKISDDVMASAAADVVDQFEDRKKRLKQRDDTGYGNDVTDKDRKDSDKKQDVFNKRLISAFVSTARRRRRRSVSTLTCDDMQVFGSAITSMTTSQIDAMADADFLDCANFLGGYSTWDSSQLAFLLSVATRSGTFGDSSSWTADNVYDAGIITQALTASEISALTNLTVDAMTSIGQHEGWSETQLSAGFARWLDLNKGGAANTVTSTELIALGHFACGASTSHISQFSVNDYSYSASYIGALTSCTESQLESYADLAESAFGLSNTWDTSVISTVGTVIGGLSASELAALSTSQFAAIDPSSIPEIPASAFVGFTVSQLSSFSVAQAQSTTASQHAGLSTAQLNALISAGAEVQSMAAFSQGSVLMIVFSFISLRIAKLI